jgi:hypothetical protein
MMGFKSKPMDIRCKILDVFVDGGSANQMRKTGDANDLLQNHTKTN